MPTLAPIAQGVITALSNDMHWQIDAPALIDDAWSATDIDSLNAIDTAAVQAQLFGTQQLPSSIATTGLQVICNALSKDTAQGGEPHAISTGTAFMTPIMAALKNSSVRSAPQVIAVVLGFEQRVMLLTRTYWTNNKAAATALTIDQVRSNAALAKTSRWRVRAWGKPTHGSETGRQQPAHGTTVATDNVYVQCTQNDEEMRTALNTHQSGKLLTAMIVIDETIQRGVPKGNEWKKLNLQSHTEQQSAAKRQHSPAGTTPTDAMKMNSPSKAAVPSPVNQPAKVRKLNVAFDDAAQDAPTAAATTAVGESDALVRRACAKPGSANFWWNEPRLGQTCEGSARTSNWAQGSPVDVRSQEGRRGTQAGRGGGRIASDEVRIVLSHGSNSPLSW